MTLLRYQNPLSYHPFNVFAQASNEASGQAQTRVDWRPAAQVLEEANQYLLRLDVPGVPRDAIELTVENRVLTLRGERQRLEREGLSYVSDESEAGTFERRFKLPQNANLESISATAKDGVLEIAIAKEASAAARTIEIS